MVAAEFPLRDWMGLELDPATDGRSRGHVDVAELHHNPNGVAHGAVVFALVDTAMGSAAMSVLEAGQACATLDIHLRFLRPVLAGRITADVRVVHRSRRFVHLSAEVTDADDRLVATATGAFAVLGDPT
jgi:acyl-CoA thioesterase